jgi:hypothetical protein
MARYKIVGNGVWDNEKNTWFHDQDPIRWEEYQQWLSIGNTPDPEVTDEEALVTAKFLKKQEIEVGFIADSVAPVEVAGYFFTGGREAIIDLHADIKIFTLLALAKVSVIDVEGTEYLITYAQADTLLKTLGQAYRPILIKRHTLLKAVRAAITVAEVDLIQW